MNIKHFILLSLLTVSAHGMNQELPLITPRRQEIAHQLATLFVGQFIPTAKPSHHIEPASFESIGKYVESMVEKYTATRSPLYLSDETLIIFPNRLHLLESIDLQELTDNFPRMTSLEAIQLHSLKEVHNTDDEELDFLPLLRSIPVSIPISLSLLFNDDEPHQLLELIKHTNLSISSCQLQRIGDTQSIQELISLLTDLAEYLPRIKYLSLCECHDWESNHIEFMRTIKALQNLETIRFENCRPGPSLLANLTIWQEGSAKRRLSMGRARSYSSESKKSS